MRHSGFLLHILFLLLPGGALAESLPTTEIESHVEAFVRQTLVARHRTQADDLVIRVSNLDPRLRLAACEQPLDMRIASPQPYGRNISVKVSCQTPKSWAIYVPTQIEQYAEVAVLSRSLARGSVLNQDDLSLTRMDLGQAGYGYLVDLQRAVGMELKRPLQAGETVRLSHLKRPQLVKKGDRVVLEANTGHISVVTVGQAMDSGREGEQIKVRNGKSERVVDAEVIGPGRVRVQL